VLQGFADRPAVPHAVERWLTVGEVAERLRVSSATVYAMCKRGQLRHVRVANAVRIGERALCDILTVG
jgi:excisionase family DNA binding protein